MVFDRFVSMFQRHFRRSHERSPSVKGVCVDYIVQTSPHSMRSPYRATKQQQNRVFQGIAGHARRGQQPGEGVRRRRGEPIFIRQAEGPWLIDVDGNRYLDYIGSWGPMILGHGHPAVVAALETAIHRGTSYGARPCRKPNWPS